MASSNLLIYYNWIRGSMLLSFGVFAQLVGPRNAARLVGFRLGHLTRTVDDEDEDDPATRPRSPDRRWADKLFAAITARDVGFAVVHFAAAWRGDPFLGRAAAAATATGILGILHGIPEAAVTFAPILFVDAVAAASWTFDA